MLLQIIVNSTDVRAGGDWVNISGSCSKAGSQWWVGIFAAETASDPIKWVDVASLPGKPPCVVHASDKLNDALSAY